MLGFARTVPGTSTWILAVGPWLVLLATYTPVPARAAVSPIEVEVEAGPVWQTKNDVRIPNNDTATRFSLVDLVGNGPVGSGRLYVTWNINDRHGVRVLAAPLTFEETGTPGGDISFAGTTFDGGVPVDATYRFNSWRVTYRYRIRDRERSRAWIGFTAKIRDAEIRIDQGSRSAKDTDVGFVPLLHLSGELDLGSRLLLRFDADALAGGPGRAIDAAIKVGYEVSDRAQFALGYRSLEGGANVDAVYNFAWLHFAVASVTVRL